MTDLLEWGLLANVDSDAAKQLGQKLVLLELSQKAAKIYHTNPIEQNA